MVCFSSYVFINIFIVLMLKMVFPINFVLCYAFDFITVHSFLRLIFVFLNVNDFCHSEYRGSFSTCTGTQLCWQAAIPWLSLIVI